jgi:cold-inducible RNA-binding protein
VNTKLYVGNLSPDVSEADLLTLFSQTGTVTEVNVALDPVTHQSRGFAFVTMAAPELAAAALEKFHCYSLGGRHITVTEARPPQEPKGMMSQGFDFGLSVRGRPDSSRDQQRRRPARFSRPRGRGR